MIFEVIVSQGTIEASASSSSSSLFPRKPPTLPNSLSIYSGEWLHSVFRYIILIALTTNRTYNIDTSRTIQRICISLFVASYWVKFPYFKISAKFSRTISNSTVKFMTHQKYVGKTWLLCNARFGLLFHERDQGCIIINITSGTTLLRRKENFIILTLSKILSAFSTFEFLV